MSRPRKNEGYMLIWLACVCVCSGSLQSNSLPNNRGVLYLHHSAHQAPRSNAFVYLATPIIADCTRRNKAAYLRDVASNSSNSVPCYSNDSSVPINSATIHINMTWCFLMTHYFYLPAAVN